MSGKFIELAGAEGIPLSKGIVFAVGDLRLALFRSSGSIVALDDPCLRCAASLADGAIDGSRVTCRGCGWTYDLRDGSVHGVPGLRTESFEVRVAGGRLAVAARPDC